MRTDAMPSLPRGLYRPGSGFSAAELQVMVHEGAVRPLLGDLYVCSSLPDAPGLRAMACGALLSGSLRAHAVLCGESAAWVHLGFGPPPRRITVITAGVYRRRTAGPIPWQVHQVPLRDDEQLELEGVPVTSPLRTAADLFLGIGTVQSRRALDAPRRLPRTDPESRAGPAGEDGCAQRWTAIRRLCFAHPEEIQLAALLEQIQARRGVQSAHGDGGTDDAGRADQHGERPGRVEAARKRQDRVQALLAARVFGA